VRDGGHVAEVFEIVRWRMAFIHPQRSLADELIAERRLEAKREAEGG
jgi:hypothetical protein